MEKRAIIFDVDGTLWDSTPVIAKAWTYAVQQAGIRNKILTPEMLKNVFGKTMDDIAEILFDGYEKEIQLQLIDACSDAEFPFIQENEADLFYPGTAETIQTLAQSYDLYIVSNCQSGYIEMMLDQSSFSDVILDTECFGNTGKNKGENIKLLMKRNGISDAVYVGDIQSDADAASQAGIPIVFAAYGFGTVENPFGTINSISELPALLDR